MNFLFTAATLVAVLSAPSYAQSAGDTITVEGTVMFGASTDWNPPASFTISNAREFYWLDLQANTNDFFNLTSVGERHALSGELASATGYLEERQGTLVLVAYNIVAAGPDSPSEADVSRVQDAMVNEFMGLSNGIGRTIQNGYYAVSIYFEKARHLHRFKRIRRAQGKSPNFEWTISERSGRWVKVILKTEVIGEIVIQPVAGVAN